jgi:5'-deoxynucleotidase YfbR-like HD superfamily hydrolase
VDVQTSLIHAFKSAILGIVLCLVLGCSTQGRVYKVYIHDAHHELFIRDMKSKDVLTYKQAHGLICVEEKDILNKFKGDSK